MAAALVNSWNDSDSSDNETTPKASLNSLFGDVPLEFTTAEVTNDVSMCGVLGSTPINEDMLEFLFVLIVRCNDDCFLMLGGVP